jgi:hypothetical protein
LGSIQRISIVDPDVSSLEQLRWGAPGVREVQKIRGDSQETVGEEFYTVRLLHRAAGGKATKTGKVRGLMPDKDEQPIGGRNVTIGAGTHIHGGPDSRNMEIK